MGMLCFALFVLELPCQSKRAQVLCPQQSLPYTSMGCLLWQLPPAPPPHSHPPDCVCMCPPPSAVHRQDGRPAQEEDRGDGAGGFQARGSRRSARQGSRGTRAAAAAATAAAQRRRTFQGSARSGETEGFGRRRRGRRGGQSAPSGTCSCRGGGRCAVRGEAGQR
jgi:hypothetical protein